MNRQEAIDLGFKVIETIYRNEYFSCWRLDFTGRVFHLNIKIENLGEQDYPTREKARQAKIDMKHSQWLCSVKTQSYAITDWQLYAGYPNGLSILDMIFIFIEEGPIKISTESWRVNSPNKEGFFNYEAAQIAWLKDRREKQVEHIHRNQIKNFRIDDKCYVIFNEEAVIEYSYGRGGFPPTTDTYLEICYFSRKAATLAMKKANREKDLAELAKIGQEIQPEYYELESKWIDRFENINRIEFISKENGREFVRYAKKGKTFNFIIQDGNKTLKIFERKD